MPLLTVDEVKAILEAEAADALSSEQASDLQEQRSAAMDYFLGDMSDHMPSTPDRSTAVSTDVADTIEGLMPSLIEIFTSGDEVVEFTPVGPEDEDAARQETDYINHVFMKRNPGFLILYTFLKDALLSKNGIVKVWHEEREVEDIEEYEDLTDVELAMLLDDPEAEVEILEHTAYAAGTLPADAGPGNDGSGDDRSDDDGTGPGSNRPGDAGDAAVGSGAASAA
ncbi:portal protein [Bauldia sp.]|uniref:portal protein n=1 Tax=Bauldia sp. TaxID=2575872 RepID=UPI003BACB96C